MVRRIRLPVIFQDLIGDVAARAIVALVTVLRVLVFVVLGDTLFLSCDCVGSFLHWVV